LDSPELLTFPSPGAQSVPRQLTDPGARAP